MHRYGFLYAVGQDSPAKNHCQYVYQPGQTATFMLFKQLQLRG